MSFCSPRKIPEKTFSDQEALEALPRRESRAHSLSLCRPEAVLSPREAFLGPREAVPAEKSLGRILSAASVSCPPAVPIVMCGERIDESAREALRRYGHAQITVVREPVPDL